MPELKAPETPLQIEIRRNDSIFFRDLQEWGGIRENNCFLNDSTRRIVELFARQNGGSCFLGEINHRKGSSGPVMWKCSDDSLVLNFSCDFCLAAFDSQLEAMIKQRAEAPYVDVETDSKRLTPIIERITALGGILLRWS